MEKMLEKFESRLDRMYGDFATAQCRNDTLEQLLEKAQVPTPVVDLATLDLLGMVKMSDFFQPSIHLPYLLLLIKLF